MSHRVLALRTLVVALSASLLGLSGPAGAASAAEGAGGPDLADQHRAVQVLTEAKDLFTGEATAAEPVRDATLVLRDLARTARDLPTSAQRRTAARLLDRPTDGTSTSADDPVYTSPAGNYCGAHICVHWVEDATADSVHGTRAQGVDGDIATVPTQVKTTLSVMERVYRTEVTGFGYRAPVSDGTTGNPSTITDGSTRTDVYLADLGNEGYYGYCTSDSPYSASASQIDAYCVLDNDYAKSQFPSHTPLQNLEVTAAHEFFHAIQFAYDANEDPWFMEGTAAWMEDQVYDDVNDNRQYLAASMLSHPYVPLDEGQSSFEYGAWIFWRYLSESSGAGSADDPTVVRDVWTRAVGSTYSTKALSQVLTARGTSLTQSLTSFGAWLRNPAKYFSEGSAYTPARLDASVAVTKARPASRLRVPMDHLSHSFVRFAAGASLTGPRRLVLTVNMANTSAGSVAQVFVRRKGGSFSVVKIPLNRSGNGSRTVAFTRAHVRSVEVDLVNAGARFSCDRGTTLSCAGDSLDDDRSVVLRARAVT